MSVSILKVKNFATGEWKEIPTIVGPTGPAGPQGEEGAQGEIGPAGKNAYEYAQEGGYTGTEAEFANELANIKELALQADVDATLDAINEISSLLGNKIPHIDNANVGQVLSVISVDKNSVPNNWQTIDPPSGGGDTLEFIKSIQLTEEVSTIKINTDADGNPLNLKRIVVTVKTIGGTPNENRSNYWVHPNSINTGAIRIDINQGVYATGAAVASVVDIQMIKDGVYLLNSSCNGNPKQTWGAYNKEQTIKGINFGVSTEDYTFGVNTIFYVMGVKV